MALRSSAVGGGPVLAGYPTRMAAKPSAPRCAKGSHEKEKYHDTEGEHRCHNFPPGDLHRFTPNGAHLPTVPASYALTASPILATLRSTHGRGTPATPPS